MTTPRTCASCTSFVDSAVPRCLHPDGLTAPQFHLVCDRYVAAIPIVPWRAAGMPCPHCTGGQAFIAGQGTTTVGYICGSCRKVWK
jgi:hypothetical protein